MTEDGLARGFPGRSSHQTPSCLLVAHNFWGAADCGFAQLELICSSSCLNQSHACWATADPASRPDGCGSLRSSLRRGIRPASQLLISKPRGQKAAIGCLKLHAQRRHSPKEICMPSPELSDELTASHQTTLHRSGPPPGSPMAPSSVLLTSASRRISPLIAREKSVAYDAVPSSPAPY